MGIRFIEPGNADLFWSEFKPYLERAALRSDHEQPIDERTRELVKAGKLMLVQVYDALETQALAACELIELRDGRSLHVRYLSGSNVEAWTDELHEGLRVLANTNKCKWVTLTGRPGWQKALKAYGMKTVSITLRAEVY